MTRQRLAAAAALLLAAVVAVAALAGVWVWRGLQRPSTAWPGAPVVVDIPPQASARAVLARLRAAGVIDNESLARAWLAWNGGERALQAGEFRFEQATSLREVLERIQHGDVLLHRVTVPEGLRLREVIQVATAAGFGSAAQVGAAFADPAPVRTLDPAASDLEGYLFPETYWFPKGQSPASIARAMVARFVRKVGPDFAERARRVRLDPA